MSAIRVLRFLAVAAGLALVLSLYSCALTSDLSGSLVGHVRVSGYGTPVQSALIECEGSTAVSAADGSYSLDGIPPGDRVVYATAAGFDSYSEIITVEESTLHDIYMNVYIGPARLYGYVSHATLGVLEGAEVKIGDLTVVTDSLGYYEFPNLLQTWYSMTVTKDGYRSFSQSNVHPTSEDYRFDVTVKKLETATVWSVADAKIMNSAPDENYGDEPELNLFNNQIWHETFYMRFDLTGIEATAEPSTATLRLYNVWDESSEVHRDILVAAVLGEWDELGVTWALGPQTTGATIAQSTYEDRWYEIDIETVLRRLVCALRGQLRDLRRYARGPSGRAVHLRFTRARRGGREAPRDPRYAW